MTRWGCRIFAFCFIVLSIVALALPRDSGIAMGVTLIGAAIPPFVTSVLALRSEPNAPIRLGEGRFFIAVFALALMACGAWIVGWEGQCSKQNARCDEGERAFTLPCLCRIMSTTFNSTRVLSLEMVVVAGFAAADTKSITILYLHFVLLCVYVLFFSLSF